LPDFFFIWERLLARTYSIRFIAADKDGNTTGLKLLNITVEPPQ
jgi:hypothetical protein